MFLQRSSSSSSKSDGDFVPSEEGSDNVSAEEPRRSRVKSARRCSNRNIDYAEEKCDSFFANTAGYTNFGRTRKGGDRRPNAAGTQDSSRFSEIPTNDKTFVFFFFFFQKRPRQYLHRNLNE